LKDGKEVNAVMLVGRLFHASQVQEQRRQTSQGPVQGQGLRL